MSTSKPTMKVETVRTSCGVCHKIGPLIGDGARNDSACIYVDYPGGGPRDFELLSLAHAFSQAGTVYHETGLTPRELLAERDAFRAESELRQHQVITCGVAATHPDPTLTLSGAYAGKWNTQQADQVRSLRAERDELLAQRDELREALQILAAYPLESFALEEKPDSHPLFGADEWRLQAGHIRAARAAIAKTKDPK